MKYRVLLLLLFFNLQISAQTSGDKIVSINANNKSLRRVLNKLQVDYNISFAYKNSLVDGQTVKVRIVDAPLQEALTRLFKNSNIAFTLKNK